MKRIQYFIPVIFLLHLGCNKNNDEPAKTKNIFEADIDGKHWQADSAGAVLIPVNPAIYGANYFQLAGRSSNGQAFYLTTKSEAPSEATFEVVFESFKVKFDLPNSNGITLNWITINELNTDRFEIERSQDGFSFTKTSEVKAAGNSSSTINYEWHEKPPFIGTFYYRLKSINTQGTYQFSTIVIIRNNLSQLYYSSPSDTAYHFGFNGMVALTSNDTIARYITGTFQFDYVDDGTGIKHTVRNGKFTNLAY